MKSNLEEYIIGNDVIITSKQIKNFLNDKTSCENLFDIASKYTSLQELIRDASKRSADLLEQFCSKESVYKMLVSEVNDELVLLDKVCNRAYQLLEEHERLSNMNTRVRNLKVLELYVSNLDKKSHECLTKFHRKEIDFTTFIKEYSDLRQLFHTYSAKLELLNKNIQPHYN